MGKLKVRKLFRENELLTARLNDTMGMLAVMVHKNGGKLVFTKEDLQTLPEATFSVNKKDGAIELGLKYQDAKEEEKQVEELPPETIE